MANEMLTENFRTSHQDLVGIELSVGHENDTITETATTGPKHDSKHPERLKEGTLPTRKSVDFAILPPTKRSRPAPEWTLKQAVIAVSVAVNFQDRFEALQKVRDYFSHDVQSLHDEELDAGADAVLAKHLAFLLWPLFERKLDRESGILSPVRNDDRVSAELSITLDALESVCRASSEAVEKSFKRLGDELIKIIMTVLNKEIDRRVNQNLVLEEDSVYGGGSESLNKEEAAGCGDDDGFESNEKAAKSAGGEDGKRAGTPELELKETILASYFSSPDGDNILSKTTRILGHFARVGEATKPLAHFPGLLGTLVRLITLFPYDRIPWEARLSAIWTVANLACNSENMQMMVCTPGLIDALIRVSCRALHPCDTIETTMEILRGRSIASRVILNLSWCPENKIVLGEQAPLIDLLSELAVHRHSPLSNSRLVREILVTTRRHAVGALRNLAAAPRRTKVALTEYKNGHILSVLTDAALNDADSAVTDRAFAAIANLAIHDTAERMVSHPALVLALKDVLLSSQEEEEALHNQNLKQNLSSSHEDGSPRAHASATLLVLERSISPDMAAYQNLRDLLDALNPSPPTEDEGMDSDSMPEGEITAI